MKTTIHRLRYALHLFGTANWQKGFDKPNFWQWLWQWRIGWGTAMKVAKVLYPGKVKQGASDNPKLF